MKLATFGLRPEWIAGQWLDEIKWDHITRSYGGHLSVGFRSLDDHLSRIGQRDFEIETLEELPWGKLKEQPMPWHEVA
jgi:hypothetical protein